MAGLLHLFPVFVIAMHCKSTGAFSIDLDGDTALVVADAAGFATTGFAAGFTASAFGGETFLSAS